MPDLGMSSLGSFLQMLKCNRNFVSKRQKFSSHLVEVYHRSYRCISTSHNTSSRVPRVVVWWRCWFLVRYGLLSCHSALKMCNERSKYSSYFRFFSIFWGVRSQNFAILWIFGQFFKIWSPITGKKIKISKKAQFNFWNTLVGTSMPIFSFLNWFCGRR